MTPLPVIITRAQPGADQSTEYVVSLGLTPLLCPMLDLQLDPSVSLPPIADLSGLIFTSANGVRFFAETEADRSLPAWCVGPATAAAARSAGFQIVHESAGDSAALARFIASRDPARDRPLLHVANSAAKGDLVRMLQAAGYDAMFAPLYCANAINDLPDAVANLIAQKQKGILLIHSHKGAEAFVRAVQAGSCAHLHAVAISNRAAEPVEALHLSEIHVASAPNEDALMGALKDAAATLSA